MPEYVFDNAFAQTPKRFGALEELYDPLTFRHLDACGVSDGWSCLEVGGGSGSVARWLAHRVGHSGRVLVTDINTRFLADLALDNVEVRQHDIASDALEERAFDLAHTRLVLLHIPARERAIERMVAALKPGGTLLLQEFDSLSLYPDPSVEHSEHLLASLKVLHSVMEERGVALRFGRALPGVLASHGLVDITAEGHVSLYRGGSVGAGLLRVNFEQMREPMLGTGAITAAEIDADLARLDDPSIAWPCPVLWTVRARKP